MNAARGHSNLKRRSRDIGQPRKSLAITQGATNRRRDFIARVAHVFEKLLGQLRPTQRASLDSAHQPVDVAIRVGLPGFEKHSLGGTMLHEFSSVKEHCVV